MDHGPSNSVTMCPSDIVLTLKLKGLGPLTYEARCGLYLHPTVAITPERLCLGVIDTLMWARDGNHFGKKSKRREKPLEEKESRRWIDGYQ